MRSELIDLTAHVAAVDCDREAAEHLPFDTRAAVAIVLDDARVLPAGIAHLREALARFTSQEQSLLAAAREEHQRCSRGRRQELLRWVRLAYHDHPSIESFDDGEWYAVAFLLRRSEWFPPGYETLESARARLDDWLYELMVTVDAERLAAAFGGATATPESIAARLRYLASTVREGLTQPGTLSCGERCALAYILNREDLLPPDFDTFEAAIERMSLPWFRIAQHVRAEFP